MGQRDDVDEPALPFPVAWRALLTSAANTPFAPLVDEHAVVSRSGQVVVSVDADDGAPRWTCALPARAGAGELLVRAGELVLTLRIRRPENLASLVAVDASGAIAWDVALDGRAARDSVVVHRGAIVVAVIAPKRGGELVTIDPRSGAISERRKSSLGTELTSTAGGLLVRDTTADANRAGLSRVRDDGTSEALAQGACWYAGVHGEHLVDVVRAGTRGNVTVRDVDGKVERWSQPVAASTGDADETHVLAVEAKGANRELVLRALATGDEIWRAPARTGEEIGKVVLAGPVVAALALDGWQYFRRADGEWIGTAETGLGPPAARGDRLYVAAPGQIICVTTR
jgi:outer membrane protein assembly factor BamB